MRAIPAEIGKRVHRLTIVGEAEKRNGRRYLLTKCDCGTVKAMDRQNVSLGYVQSCGCLRFEFCKKRKVHGHAGGTNAVGRTSEYRIWSQMIQRCENENNPAYDRYGGRGISVCESWRNFEKFLADMGRRPSSERSLDRINNDGNYEPGNCRWATRSEQMKNRRPFKRKRK